MQVAGNEAKNAASQSNLRNMKIEDEPYSQHENNGRKIAILASPIKIEPQDQKVYQTVDSDQNDALKTFTGYKFSGDVSRYLPDKEPFLQDKREKKNVLKELGCRLKSMIYQKGFIPRKEILETFRKKDFNESKETSQKQKRSAKQEGTMENNWRRRIYDALNVLQNSGAVEINEKTINIPKQKINLNGLIVLREELFKDLFAKKKIISELEKEWLKKVYDLGFLKGLVDSRKASCQEKEVAADEGNEEGTAEEMLGKRVKVKNGEISTDKKKFRLGCQLLKIGKDEQLEIEFVGKHKVYIKSKSPLQLNCISSL